MTNMIYNNKNLTEQYKILHTNNKNYGSSSIELINEISLIIDYLKPKIVLDYGCGKGSLIKALIDKYPEIKFYGYDPSIPGLDTLPVEKADLVINTDVLEHIPEDILPNVVEKISNISQYVFFNLHHAKATAILPNGENAHCTIKDRKWYENLFRKYFGYVDMEDGRHDVNSVCFTFFMPNDLKIKYYKSINRETLEMKIDKLLGKKHKNKLLFKFLSIFIFNKKKRHKFRKKYIK